MKTQEYIDFQEWKNEVISNKDEYIGNFNKMRMVKNPIKFYKKKGYDVSELEKALGL